MKTGNPGGGLMKCSGQSLDGTLKNAITRRDVRCNCSWFHSTYFEVERLGSHPPGLHPGLIMLNPCRDSCGARTQPKTGRKLPRLEAKKPATELMGLAFDIGKKIILNSRHYSMFLLSILFSSDNNDFELRITSNFKTTLLPARCLLSGYKTLYGC